MNKKAKRHPHPVRDKSKKKGSRRPGEKKDNPVLIQDNEQKSERIAKRIARAGLCSRRDAENWILAGRVRLNGELLISPAITVTGSDQIEVDGSIVDAKERTRVWLYHKPSGLLSTNRDPEGRPTIFEKLPAQLPRVLSVGRLDMNTEGLMLLTNDGGLARILELPATGWLRRYRVRAHGKFEPESVESLRDGIAVDGVLYGSIEASLDRQQGHNCWLTVAIREGKNREVKKVLSAIGLEVNRLIRVSYGPFQLGELAKGEAIEIRGKILREQLGARLIEQSGADFDAPLIQRKLPSDKTSKGDAEKRISNKFKKKTPRGAIAQGTKDQLETKSPMKQKKSRSATFSRNPKTR